MNRFKKQIENLTEAEMTAKLRELQQQLAKAGLELARGKVKNRRSKFNLRKQIAIILSKNI